MRKIKPVPTWETSDGKTFDNRTEAANHERRCLLVTWLQQTLTIEDAEELADRIAADRSAFRAAVKGVLAEPRQPHAEGGTKRRGRPPKVAA